MTLDDDDSPLLAALRDDLPSAGEEARLRKRLVAAGVAVGNGLTASSVAAASAAAPAGVAAAASVQAATLSWVAKAGIALALAAPVAAVPLLRSSYAPTAGVTVPSARQLARSPDQGVHFAGTSSSLARQRARAAAPVAGAAVQSQAASSNGGAARELAPSKPSEIEAKTSALTAVAGVKRNEEPVRPAAAAVGTPDPVAARAFAVVPSTLGEETRLLDAAFVALAAGETARARRLLDEHEGRFPNGLLQQERQRARTRLAEVLGEGARE